jgi:hypothetical protein
MVERARQALGGESWGAPAATTATQAGPFAADEDSEPVMMMMMIGQLLVKGPPAWYTYVKRSRRREDDETCRGAGSRGRFALLAAGEGAVPQTNERS